MPPIITLTTDFGLKDHYVGVLKAVILGILPDAKLIDISHEIPPQDVMAGAWVVRNSASWFPNGTVHLVVVDPGVGTDRKPVALEIDGHYFVGPDNGIFSLIADDRNYKACTLNRKEFWRENLSKTFHGRDIFAPVAAHLANGTVLEELGDPLEELVTYRWAKPIADRDGIQGWIVHIDSYGNLITNIPESMVREVASGRRVKIYIGNTILHEMSSTFADVEEGEPAAYVGSAGMVEVAVNKGNAGELLSVRKGAQISIVLQK
ncbi:MAG: SAM-dependent chlorinase/fluorinase [Balneolaceae bacterium]